MNSVTASARLTIDLAALVGNYRLVAERVAPARTAAVLKANAYGLGASKIAPALETAGCSDFFVATLDEAIELRPVLGAEARVFVLNGLVAGAEPSCVAASVLPVINTLDQAGRWRAHARACGRSLPCALQLDSGMSRLGLSSEDVATLTRDKGFFDDAPPALVLSHLACADEADHEANLRQAKTFASMARSLPAAPRSLANSGGVFLSEAFHHDLVRVGLALYGAAPIAGRPNPMRPVVRLHARVLQVADAAPGQGVGYGLTYARRSPGRLATIGLGYADGWPRSLSNRGAAYFQGVRLPIAGRVSMDSLTLDVSDLADRGIEMRPGDEVEFLGDHQTLEMVAGDAGTIPHEILTTLGGRYHRVHLGEAPEIHRRPAPSPLADFATVIS